MYFSKLKVNGWKDDMIREQIQITAGIIIPQGRSGKKLHKKSDYILFYAPNFKIALVEANLSIKLLDMAYNKQLNMQRY